MEWIFFAANSLMLGVGLAMDAFSVSIANGINAPSMSKRTMLLIAGTFGFFQFLMPMLGWICVHLIVEAFSHFQAFIPWIAFFLLGFLGGKMTVEAILGKNTPPSVHNDITMPALFMQGVATSIDALSTGFAIAGYGPRLAFAASVIIAAVTFAICLAGLSIGRLFGHSLARKASVAGGLFLVFIGFEIVLSSVLE
ncbi:MAG: manganese efflux pump [Mailhella sp.]|nr:manganese efflux pump [Mailhella sp.]